MAAYARQDGSSRDRRSQCSGVRRGGTTAVRPAFAQSFGRPRLWQKLRLRRHRAGLLASIDRFEHGFQAYWSRRITDERRLAYKIAEDEIRIAACRYRYER
jgi:hypothetical protein